MKRRRVFPVSIFVAVFGAALSALLGVRAMADVSSTTATSADLVPGYTETYTFSTAGKSFGTQSATLTKVENNQETWSFTIDLMVPTSGTPTIPLLKQTGTYTVDSDFRPINLDTTAVTGGASQGEKLSFADGNVTCDFDPSIAAVAHSFPVGGHPYLVVNNLISLLSLVTRANRNIGATGLVVNGFSGNALRPLQIMFHPMPSPVQQDKAYSVYQMMLTVPGLPQVTNIVWLSNRTGEIVRLIDNSQNLLVVKD
jgi:hypothetical protein